ncbi:MAG TPA: RNA polymerase sigma factor [Ktedonobacteraceae bacterium]|nr:RNA polymerase sigma factor [Ktedonobacteraceae bacterium]
MPPTARDPTTSRLPEKESWYVEVVEQARAGDKLAFDTLFEYNNTRICTYLAHIVGNEEEGRDLAQETFLKAWQAIGSIYNEACFDTWLYRIATNLAIDYLRRRKFHWSSWETIENEDVPASMRIAGPEELVAEKEHVRQALAKVSLKYRTCLLLQLVADFSQRQIAASLKISEKSVSVYVSRGREQFRIAYQQLSRTNEQIMKDRGKSSDNIEPYPLFRLGAETFGQTFG